MTSIAEKQFDRPSHPDNIPFISNILWERSDNFDPDLLNRVFEEESHPFEHETFGQGNRWYLGFIGGMRTKLDFYPNSRVLFMTYNDSKNITQERMYVVDAIGLGHVEERKGVAFTSERDMKSEIVLVQANGNFDEFHRRLTFTKQDLPLPTVQEETITRKKIVSKAPEQPQWLSKDPAQLTKGDIESLFKILSSKHKRLYNNQTRIAVNIASNLMKSLIEIINGYQLEEYETAPFDYLKMRFIQNLKTEAVADKIGYSREHISRTIRAQAMELLYKYTRKG